MPANQTLLPLVLGLTISSVVMLLLWMRQRQTGNAGVVDVAWSAIIGVLGLLYAVWPGGLGWLKTLVAGMIAVWSFRLTTYLYRRVVGHPEEGRYATLRERWGAKAVRQFFWFFQFQALAAWCFALPVMVIARSSEAPAVPLVVVAVFLWLLGVGGVTLADWQLVQFKADASNRGKTCRRGLWRYSRHPNYFFEWLHWCAYVPLSLGSDYWWISAMIAIGLLLTVLFVTGIPPTEAQALASRGDDYRRYQRSTNAFVPWFPKLQEEQQC